MPATPTVQLVSFAHAPRLLAHLLPRNGVIVIGGPSGSGKSTLARRLIEHLPAHAAHLQVEESYLGWRGLNAGLGLVERALLRANDLGHADLVTWDWLRSKPSSSTRLLPPSRLRAPLVIEGVGADCALAHLANLVVRVEAPPPLRAKRVAVRDGYWPQLWDRWAADEEAHAHTSRLARGLGGTRAALATGHLGADQGCGTYDVGHLVTSRVHRYFRVVP